MIDEKGEEKPIVTDRPHFCEASSLVGLGAWQVETGYTFYSSNSGGQSTMTSSLPEGLLRVGVFANWFEFRLGANFLSERTRYQGLGTSDGGFDDLYLGAKIGLFGQNGWLPEVALFPQTRVPVGQKDLTDDAWLPGFNLAYSWVITDWLELECNTQLNRRRDDDAKFYVELIQAANFEYQLSKRLGAFTEWFALIPDESESATARPEHYFHTGLVYLITPVLQYDIHAAVGLNEWASDFFAGTGLSARF